MNIFDRSEAAMSAGSAAHVAKAAISLSAVLRRACSRGWPLLARSHCLLLALVVAAVDMAPLQVQADANKPKPVEGKMDRKQKADCKKSRQLEGIDRVKAEVKVMGSSKQQRCVMQALEDIYSIKEGKEFLDGISLKGLKIRFWSSNGRTLGIYYSSTKTIGLADNLCYDRTSTLFHELRHYAQNCEGRLTKDIRGVEGYADFVIAKLTEVEATLFEHICLAKISRTGTVAPHQEECSEYYKGLEEKYRAQGLTEDEASKSARTEHVKTLWEASPGNDLVPAFSVWWDTSKEHILDKALKQPVGKRDIQKEYDIIQGYIKAMDIDLDMAYFFNTGHWNLEKKYQQELDKRERKCGKKGTCLDLLNRKSEDGDKVKEGKAGKAK